MGLWNFIKDAGKKIGIGDDEKPEEAIAKEVAELGLEAENLDVKVEGDKVILAGAAPSQSIREKIILAAGNVMGIGSVEENIEAPDAKEPVFHTVAKGENLWKISEKYLGSGAKYMEIFEANKPMLSDPDKIYPGQNLRIPE